VGGFEIVEHTADVGIRAAGDTLEEVFYQTTRGLIEIEDAWRPGEGDRLEITLEARDLIALMVDWLNEVLYLQDSRDAVFGDVVVDAVTPTSITGTVTIHPREEDLQGTAVKAVTFHRLEVLQGPDGGWRSLVYVDV
jgi:SHS2 domain-containing protein